MQKFATEKYVDQKVDRAVGHQFGIVTEHFDQKFLTIREGLNSIDDKCEKLESRSGQLEKRLADFQLETRLKLGKIIKSLYSK